LVDLDAPWVVQRDRNPLALERTPVLKARGFRAGLANHGCGPHSVLRRDIVRGYQHGGSGRLDAADPAIRRGGNRVFCGYLLGSIPFGLLLTRAAGLGDVRDIGSGNIGATNVLRTGNKGLAAATLFLDMLKGTVAVLIAGMLPGPSMRMAAGVGAFVGHLYPVWLNFKGGKGVATYLGVLLGLAWQGALVFAAVWLLVAYLFRYSSLAALVAAAVVPGALYMFGFVELALLFSVLSIIVIIKHKANIERLLAGTETRIGKK
jgi:glycerol-3-phosphate acyltransferase PlsY